MLAMIALSLITGASEASPRARCMPTVIRDAQTVIGRAQRLRAQGRSREAAKAVYGGLVRFQEKTTLVEEHRGRSVKDDDPMFIELIGAEIRRKYYSEAYSEGMVKLRQMLKDYKRIAHC